MQVYAGRFTRKVIIAVSIFIFAVFGGVPAGIFTDKADAITTTFNASGTWQAPAGVTQVLVEAWGGGGAGGGRGSSTGQSGGGGGGAYASRTISVTPLQTYSYTVGPAVTGGAGNGPDGNLSQWETGTDIKAAGGKGGANNVTKGLGGAVIDSTGSVVFKGGDGADGASVSGGGGGGAGSTGNGGNASGGTAGAGTTTGGGNGGAGVTNANGNPGSAAGGGGSGARRTNGNRSGGNGAAGQIRITYNQAPSFTVTATDLPDPVSYGSPVTFSATATDSEHSWKLVVCKTDSVTPGVNPVCASGQDLCISASAVASGNSNNCTWTSDQSGSINWYAFACDNTSTQPACSSADTSNSPLMVNVIISISITSDGTIDYGNLGSGQTTSTINLSDTQTAQNDTNIPEDLNIKTSVPPGWSLGSSPATDTFVHEYSINGGSNWTMFVAGDSYQTLATNILPSASQNFDLRITAPSPATTSSQKTIDITIQAVQN